MSISYTADQLQRKFQGAPGGSGFARIAETLREEGRLEEAVALCQEGLGSKPQDLSGRLVLGKCLIDMDRPDEAREQLEGVLRQDPRCLSAMHLLARIMTRLQWGEAAAAYYRSILELEPWDAETRSRLSQVNPAGAAGQVPAEEPAWSGAGAGSSAPPVQTLEALESAAPSGPEVEEFDLNEVTGFPSAESTPGDLAGALEEISLEDALSAPAEEPRALAPHPPAPTPEEPKPLDILTEAAPVAEPGADEPAPISGDDVGERLDSLFGAEDDRPMSASPIPSEAPSGTAPGGPDPDFADATLQLKAMRDQETPAGDLGAATTFAGPAAEAAPAALEAPAAPDVGFREDSASPLETSVFSGGDLLPPEERVSGEDIEARLDDLFSLHDTSTQPVMKAIPDETDPSGTDLPGLASPEAAPAPEAVGTWSGAALTEADQEDAPEAEAAGDVSSTPTLSEGEVVTGQDVADKLDSLFGEEAPPAAAAAKEADDPSLLESGSASWAAARPSRDDADAATATGFAAAPPADAPPRAEDAAPAWDAGAGPFGSASQDLMTTESMLPRGPEPDQSPPVTGEDIENRLDSLFDLGDEPAATGSIARVETPVEESLEAFPPSSPEPYPADAPEEVTPEEPLASAPSAPASGDLSGDGSGERTMMMPNALPGAGDTLFMSNEEVFAEPPAAAQVPGAVDTVGFEMVDGTDIAERLDQIFASEGPVAARDDAPAAAAKAAAEAALARGETGEDALPAFAEPEFTLPVEEPPMPAVEPVLFETGTGTEAPAPRDEVSLFAEDPVADQPFPEGDALEVPGPAAPQDEIVISGEDIKDRLSEIFEPPTGQAVRPMEDEEAETPLFLADSGHPPAAAASAPTPAADAGTRAPETGNTAMPSLSPLQDEEEGALEEEEMGPQSAAGANVATVTLAEIYFQQGLREQALQIYRQLLEREPGNDSVRKRIQEIEASKPEAGTGPGTDQRRPRPGLKVPKRKK